MYRFIEHPLRVANLRQTPSGNSTPRTNESHLPLFGRNLLYTYTAASFISSGYCFITGAIYIESDKAYANTNFICGFCSMMGLIYALKNIPLLNPEAPSAALLEPLWLENAEDPVKYLTEHTYKDFKTDFQIIQTNIHELSQRKDFTEIQKKEFNSLCQLRDEFERIYTCPITLDIATPPCLVPGNNSKIAVSYFGLLKAAQLGQSHPSNRGSLAGIKQITHQSVLELEQKMELEILKMNGIIDQLKEFV